MTSSRSRAPSGRCPCLRRSAACSTSSANATRVTRSLRGGEVHPELEALLALQEKDQAVTATDEALAALAPELSKLDEAQAAAERALAVARGGIQAAIDRRDQLAGSGGGRRARRSAGAPRTAGGRRRSARGGGRAGRPGGAARRGGGGAGPGPEPAWRGELGGGGGWAASAAWSARAAPAVR